MNLLIKGKKASRVLILFTASLLFSIQALAHTGLKESTPADESVVSVAPAKIDLVFTGPVRLIKLDLMKAEQEIATGFEASTESKAAYSIATPGLQSGVYTVNWAVIGADGHTVANSYSFEVKPGS
jgi:copper resistance protein C